jgi:hypothetical protein
MPSASFILALLPKGREKMWNAGAMSREQISRNPRGE